MKKAKILTLIALALCLATFFASCGAKGILKYTNAEYEEGNLFNSISKVSGISGVSAESLNELVLLKDNKHLDEGLTYDKYTYIVYNLSSNEAVFSVTVPDAKTEFDVKLYEISDVTYFVVTTLAEGEIKNEKAYTATGGTIASTTGAANHIHMLDDFKFGNAVYTTDKKNKIVKLGDLDEFTSLEADAYSKDYTYSFNDGIMTVTDKLGASVSSYEIKTHYLSDNFDEPAMGILANGNVFFQYMNLLPDDAKKYDVFIDGVKADLITEIFNVAKGSTKEVDVDFICELAFGGTSIDANKDFEEDFDLNTAFITNIVDQRIEQTQEFVVLDNKLNIKANAEDIVIGFDDMECIGEDRFVIEDISDKLHFMVDGKIIKTVSADTVAYNDKYIYSDETVYDLDFNKLLDLTDKNYKVAAATANSLLLARDVGDKTEYSIYTNEGKNKIIVAADSTATYVGNTHGLYSIISSDGKHIYYNAAGEVVASLDFAMTVVAADADNGNMLVVSGTDYYRICAKAKAE